MIVWSMILFAAVLYASLVFRKPYLRLYTPQGQNYLTRWRLVSCKWFRVYLHRLDAPDPDRHLHNHPWDGLVLVLRKPGSYVQLTCATLAGPLAVENIARVNRLGATFHKITHLRPGTWTLVIAGPIKREWGFRVHGRFVHWEEYVRRYQKGVLHAKGTVSGRKL